MFVKKFPSGWCSTGHHTKCSFVLQEKADVYVHKDRTVHKPEVRCSCDCHKGGK
jgi:hypothetical protein